MSYIINENVTKQQLRELFEEKSEAFVKRFNLTEFIVMNITVSKEDNFMVVSVTDKQTGIPYAPFYNPQLRHDNKVAEQVMRRYESIMDSFVEKGIMFYKSEICEDGLQVKVKYFCKDIDKIAKIEKGDWIDLRSAEDVSLKAGDFRIIKLGVGMVLPDGYEAHIAPRSSTYKNFGIIQTNSVGVVDNSYSGDNDQWGMPVLAMRDTVIKKNDRICQFRIVEKQPCYNIKEVDKLNSVSRGGFGSTGK